MTADLHCHTKLSDGSIGIDDLIILAKKKDIKTIAITDHDCLAGTVRGKIIGERHGVEVVPGVELSAFDSKSNRYVHILCYYPDSPDRLEGLCRRNSLARKKASQYMILKVAQRYPITGDLVLKCATGSTNVFKQHIMHALMQCNITTELFGELYHELFNPQSSNNVLVNPPFPDPKEVVELVKSAGGVAVLSHPAHSDCVDLIDELMTCGLDGIEVWHPCHNQEQTQALAKLGKSKGLLLTGGSDFHGMYSPVAIGVGGIEVPQQHLNAFFGYKARLKRQAKKAELLMNE